MRFAVLAIGLVLLGGCATNPASSPGAAPPAPPPVPSTSMLRAGFDSSTSLPAGWTPDAGTWSVSPNLSAPSPPNVLRGVGGGGRSTLRANASYRDFEATVKFNMQGGDEGAGLSFRYTPAGDYRIIRYSVREDGWHYFTAKGNAGDKWNEATLPQNASHPRYNEWVTLRVRAEGSHLQAWDRDTLVIEFNDTAPAEGTVGPFLRGGAVALFDDLDVRPLGDP